MLGFGVAIGMQYLWQYCKHTKRASNHILGKSKKIWGVMEMQAASQPASCYPYPMTSPFPPSPGVMQATAPPAQGTAVVPWKYSNNAAWGRGAINYIIKDQVTYLEEQKYLFKFSIYIIQRRLQKPFPWHKDRGFINSATLQAIFNCRWGHPWMQLSSKPSLYEAGCHIVKHMIDFPIVVHISERNIQSY